MPLRLPPNPFASTLWIDQPDADARIARLRASEEDRELLRHFRREGYVRVALDPAREPIDELVADLDRLWREKPRDVLFAYEKPFLRPMADADEAHERKPGYRVQEVQSHSRAARRLFLQPRLHAIARLILGETPVAIQSILFEYGSTQALHRDPVFVQTEEAGHLMAAWIALEDVHEDAGPLAYVPRSHTLPPYEYAPGAYRFDSRLFGQRELDAERDWLAQQSSAHGLERHLFTAKKGEVLFWHAGLYHGGDAIRDAARTRKSFVVHYSTLRTHHTSVATVLEGGQLRIAGTHRLIGNRHALGFANPIAKSGDVAWWATLRNRLRARN